MKLTLQEIDKAEMIVNEFSEKGVGLGIEARYAFAKGIPIFVIAKRGSDISSTISGITKAVFLYDDLKECSLGLSPQLAVTGIASEQKYFTVNYFFWAILAMFLHLGNLLHAKNPP